MRDLAPALLELTGARDYLPADCMELMKRLRLPAEREADLKATLDELERLGRLARIKGHRYVQPRDADLIPGRIRINRQGKGFLQPDEAGIREIVIPESATGTALHEDRVLVRRDVPPKGLRPEAATPVTGTVVRILERRRTRIVGTLQSSRKFLFVIPDDPRIPHDIYVPPSRDTGRPARPGDKVVVELREWVSRHTNPEGEIVEVLGAPDEEGVDMLSVLRQYDLPLHFPREALNEARAIGTEVTAHDLPGRTDCREHDVVTIDPDDAKDFDDAICLQRAVEGGWRLWVHIADVSHYVKPGTALDAEARRRGNSTYLVDRVIPMLPEALSNELCSLKPHVDRLTKCVEFRVSDEGEVLETRLFQAVIHSKRRYTYAEVLLLLGRSPVDPIEQMLHDAHQLAQRIRRLRFKAGSLDLDFPETKIRLDDQGRVLRIEKTENDVSHQLIEEFMLLANEATATRLMQLRTPAVYRVHEVPDERRLREYREDVLSHGVQCGNLTHPGEVQKLLHRLGGSPIGPALKIGLLRSLMRARYDVTPLGHYGLAKERYTHFTSPIRRYADLVVHRALFSRTPDSLQALKEIAEHISATERNSADAERDSKDVKLYAYLNAQLKSGAPTPYPALVTDVRNFGFFVDVPGLALSGAVPLSMLEDDFYVFDPSRNHLVGRRRRRVIRLGDQVTVQVARVDRFKKQVDFRLAEEARVGRPVDRREEEPGRHPHRPGAGAPRPSGRPQHAPARGGQPGIRELAREGRGRPAEVGRQRPAGRDARPGRRLPSSPHSPREAQPATRGAAPGGRGPTPGGRHPQPVHRPPAGVRPPQSAGRPAPPAGRAPHFDDRNRDTLRGGGRRGERFPSQGGRDPRPENRGGPRRGDSRRAEGRRDPREGGRFEPPRGKPPEGGGGFRRPTRPEVRQAPTAQRPPESGARFNPRGARPSYPEGGNSRPAQGDSRQQDRGWRGPRDGGRSRFGGGRPPQGMGGGARRSEGRPRPEGAGARGRPKPGRPQGPQQSRPGSQGFRPRRPGGGR
jgi:ribonuclease R